MRAWEIDRSLLREPIIDIGSGAGPLQVPGLTVQPYDKEHGDAHYMPGVVADSYYTVYSHHCLEHLEDPLIALRIWWMLLRVTGHLIVTVPHRDLYEKRRTLPSRFNPDHKTMWLPDQEDPPNTFSLLRIVRQAIPDGELLSLRTITEGFEYRPANEQSPEGFHLEIVLKKIYATPLRCDS